ncbi:MAG: transposase [Edaphobacter sp.]
MPSSPSPRVRINPETFAITAVTHRRHRIFQRTTNADLLLNILFRYRNQSRYQLHGFVIMPDHIHALLTPPPTKPSNAASNSSKAASPSLSAATSMAKSGKTAITPIASLT